MSNYSEIAVDSTEGEYRVYVEVNLAEGEDFIDLHCEDAVDGVDLRLSIDEALTLIRHLTTALPMALANH